MSLFAMQCVALSMTILDVLDKKVKSTVDSFEVIHHLHLSVEHNSTAWSDIVKKIWLIFFLMDSFECSVGHGLSIPSHNPVVIVHNILMLLFYF